MFYGLHTIGFMGNKLKIIKTFIAIFTTIATFKDKLQQKQCDLTLNV